MATVSVRTSAWRFLLVGGTNTLVTTVALIGLSYLISGPVAFTIVFALGLVASTLFAARWVFSTDSGLRSAMIYASAYIVIYLAGLLISVGIQATGAPPWANAASVVVTAPLGFLAGRLVFSRSDRRPTFRKENR